MCPLLGHCGFMTTNSSGNMYSLMFSSEVLWNLEMNHQPLSNIIGLLQHARIFIYEKQLNLSAYVCRDEETQLKFIEIKKVITFTTKN